MKTSAMQPNGVVALLRANGDFLLSAAAVVAAVFLAALLLEAAASPLSR